jgi:adenylate cyclase
MILATAAVLAVSSYLTARNALLQFSKDLIGQNARVVQEQVRSFLRPSGAAAELTIALAQRGMVQVDDPERLEEYFFDFLSVHTTVSMLNYGDTDGNFVMVKRQPDGSLSTKRVRVAPERRVVWRHRDRGGPLEPPREEVEDPDDPYDPRTRLWYRGAVADRGLHWTGVYVFHSDQQPGITAAAPHYGADGTLRGVLSVDIGLFDLSHFLAEQIQVGASGEAFLLDDREQLVAVRDVDALTMDDPAAGAGAQRLRFLEESARPEIAALAAEPQVRRFLDEVFAGGEPAPLTLRYRVGDEDYVGTLLAIEVSATRRWVTGVVAREDEFLGAARRANRNALFTAIGLALVALVIGVLVARVIARSLRRLVEESVRVRRLELTAGGARSSFREVDEVLGAFESMKAGLRAFEKYMPVRLVRQLLEKQQEPVLGGEDRTLTVLFSDIRGFSAISERLEPHALAHQLGRYLSAVTRCIQDRHGTVDKYIGDAVMAFWGAPQEVPDHPLEACRAALDVIDAIRVLQEADPEMPDLYTRIGIHTADVVVGNFGSDDRLSYTIIGDGVNLANRLEGINKVFGTQIAISDDTAAAVAGQLETRRLAPVAVLGRVAPCMVHELLGERGRVAPERLAAAREYERALGHYLAGDFTAAIAVLDEMSGRDAAGDWLFARCRGLAVAPAPPGWDGTVAMEST